MTEMHNPPHPGEVLREWLSGISVTEAAKRLGVTRVALSRLLNGSAGVSAEMDLRLSKALGTTPGSWYAMQANYDMWQAQRRFRAKVRPITKQAHDDCAGDLRPAHA
jgi:antitoxin HigA-1